MNKLIERESRNIWTSQEGDSNWNLNNNLNSINLHFQNLLRFSNDEINILQLKCLKTKQSIKIPVRGADCAHIECYDENCLKEFLESNESLACILCGKIISIRNVVRDRFLYAIMKNKSYKTGMSINIMKSSCAWSYLEKEVDKQIEKFKEDDQQSILEYVNSLDKKIHFDILIFPEIISNEKFSISFLINKDSYKRITNKFSILNILNFSQMNDRFKIEQTGFLKNYVNFYYLVEKFYKEDKNIIFIIINEILAYLIYILSIRSYPVFLIDQNFLRMVNFISNEFYFIQNLLRILNLLIIKDFLIVLIVNSQKEKENFLNYFKNFEQYAMDNLDEEFFNRNFKIFTEKELIDHNKIQLLDSSYLNSKLMNIKKFSSLHDNCDDFISNFIKILNEDSCNLNPKIFLNLDKTQMLELKEFNQNITKFSISGKINEEFLAKIIFESPIESKYIITSANKIYSNFTHSTEEKIFHPIEIDLEILPYFINANNIENFKLISQFKNILTHQNFILTNLKDLNPTIIFKLTHTKGNFIDLMDSLNNIKQKKHNCVILSNNLSKTDLKEILNKFSFYPISNYEDVIITYHDEYELKYFFILEKEIEYDEIFYEELEKIVNDLKKLKISSVENLYLRNKMNFIKEKIFCEIRMMKEEK